MAATFVVEDGTGLADANAYITVAEADQYHQNHGAPSDWTGMGSGDKQRHIREATQYLDGYYRDRMRGVKATQTQRLEHPKTNLVDIHGYLRASNEVQTELKDACAIAALKSRQEQLAGSSLLPDFSTPGAVRKTRQKLDVLEEEIVYDSANPQQKQYQLIDLVLAPLLVPALKVSR